MVVTDRGPAVVTSCGPSRLRVLAMQLEDLQKARIAAGQRQLPEIAEGLARLEKIAARELQRELRSHAIWPWLSQFRGLRGSQVAIVIASIEGRDGRGPHRFPGARSLWKYGGLAPGSRRVKGQKASWDPRIKRAVLMPDLGLAAQIVRHRTPLYAAIHDAAKDRLSRERAVAATEIDARLGPLPTEPAEAGSTVVIASTTGLRPYQIEQRARLIAAKAFVADLWTAWKRLAPADPGREIDRLDGEGEACLDPVEWRSEIDPDAGGIQA